MSYETDLYPDENIVRTGPSLSDRYRILLEACIRRMGSNLESVGFPLECEVNELVAIADHCNQAVIVERFLEQMEEKYKRREVNDGKN